MHEASKINVGVSAGNHKAKYILRPALTFEKVVAWIKSKNHDEEVTAKLIKVASGFPEKTYHVFKKNYPKYLEQIIKKER